MSLCDIFARNELTECGYGSKNRWMSEKLTTLVITYSPFGVQVWQSLEISPLPALVSPALSMCMCIIVNSLKSKIIDHLSSAM